MSDARPGAVSPAGRLRPGARALPLVLLLAPLATAGEEGVDRALAHARRARPAVVRVEWRAGAGAREVVRRHAVVVHPDGWLLMAGPPPPARGTLAALFEGVRAMRAHVWASDPRTCLTLLRVPVVDLPRLLLQPEDDEAAPFGRLPPGARITMVTGDGAVARGELRASHRRRRVEDPDSGRSWLVTCLDEAAMAVIPTDLGAPWLDGEGRVAGLLVGADVVVPAASAAGDENEPDALRPEVAAAYAVPAAVVRVVWPLLRDRRRVPRAVLGVRTQDLMEALRVHVCPDCGGQEVLAVAPHSPAAEAGLQPWDVIYRVGDRLMPPGADLADLLLPHRPGERVSLGVIRRGSALEVEVVLGAGE